MKDLTISNLQSILPEAGPAPEKTGGTSTAPFSDYVKHSLEDVNRRLLQADQKIDDLVTGKNQDISNTMISMQKAEISFELVTQIRNKIIAAYDEIKRMSI
jgi:flagellar hook-basal body complex protein FliE